MQKSQIDEVLNDYLTLVDWQIPYFTSFKFREHFLVTQQMVLLERGCMPVKLTFLSTNETCLVLQQQLSIKPKYFDIYD